ncbi:MAG: ABC transporter ATP-binding protein, partial [Gammaproteobacteria bacterium]|nr:ABC transporter ATP-binding protein [Gammaproteobacteria bacterium]
AAALLIDKTVLFIAHDPLEALRLSDVIYVLSGRPVTLGNAIHPQGLAPRDLTDEKLLLLQGQLLLRLEKAQENMPL